MKSLFKKTILTKTIFFVLADIFSIVISIWLAFFLRFDGNIPPQFFAFIYRMSGLAVIFIIPIFYFQKLYSFSWTYVSASEAISLFKATTMAFFFLSIAIFISHYFPRFTNFPRSVIFVSYILVFILCGALRFSKRIYLRLANKGILGLGGVLIVGAGDAGEQILRGILSEKSFLKPVGFVDDNPVKKGVLIHGVKVLGKISDIPELAKKYQIKQLIIALPSGGNYAIKNAVDFAKKAGIKKIKITPPLSEIIKGKVFFSNLKDVEVEDLLGREQVDLDTKEIKGLIADKTILITGAAGSIGSELSRQVAKFNPKTLLLLDQDETGIFDISKELKNDFSDLDLHSLVADVRDKERLSKIFKDLKPQIVFHAAAYKHVPLMEENPEEAVKNNVFGTENLAAISVENNVEKFVLISTDKAVNPTSVMGMTKRVGEMICNVYNHKSSAKFISVRFGNVLNSRGSVIPIFREQIKKGGPVEVTDPEMKRYFMLIPEACLLVMQAGAISLGGEVFVLDMGKPIKIMDLAKEMIRFSGLELDKDIAIVFTGARPGEKLFEEILTGEEGIAATKNKKIYEAKMSGIDESKLRDNLKNIAESVKLQDKKEIKDILRDIVLHR